MTDSCCCPSEAGNAVCDLSKENTQRLTNNGNACPVCGTKGKPVQGQTVKALLSVSLREVQDDKYLFCKTPTCPTVYFTSDGKQTFTVAQIREHVYQKESENDDTLVCYCFQHKIGDLRTVSPEEREAIIDDINKGIQAGQCACDLRNPQGSCCLGNVHGLIKNFNATSVETRTSV